MDSGGSGDVAASGWKLIVSFPAVCVWEEEHVSVSICAALIERAVIHTFLPSCFCFLYAFFF